MTTAFVMSLDVAEEFFNRCLLMEAITEPERVRIMDQLVAEKKAGRFTTGMSKERLQIELAKHANLMTVSKKRKKTNAKL